MKGKEICIELENLLSPIISSMGYEFVCVYYLKENRNWIVRVSIDKEGGVSLNDCEHVSKVIDGKLDEADLIKTSYLLEVCSPGLDRPLIKEKDYIRFQGEKIKVKTKEPLENRKNFTGMLKELREGMVTLIDGEEIFLIPLEKIQKANLVTEIDF
ncbi:MAG: ribosome maturation factor RimP [Candidatus Eremiobacterota bacterium]